MSDRTSHNMKLWKREADRLAADNAALRTRVATLEDGIRGLWETWMDDDASWVEVAGTLDELHTSLDASHDRDNERARQAQSWDASPHRRETVGAFAWARLMRVPHQAR